MSVTPAPFSVIPAQAGIHPEKFKDGCPLTTVGHDIITLSSLLFTLLSSPQVVGGDPSVLLRHPRRLVSLCLRLLAGAGIPPTFVIPACLWQVSI